MTAAIAAAVLLLGVSPDAQAAIDHRESFPRHEWGYHYYFTLSEVPESRRESLAKTLNYVVASLSREQYLEDQLPQRISDTCLHLDTRGPGWEHTLPKVLIQHYPYARQYTTFGIAPLCIRADWFVANIGDETFTGNGQFLLLYGRELKDRADFLKQWKVSTDVTDTFGFLEGSSGVKRQGAGLERNMESRATGRGATFETFDSRLVVGANDALENPDKRPPAHDASEIIAPNLKVGRDENGKIQAGALLAFFLADAKGARQKAAPVEIVEDAFNLRGYDIKQYMDCVSCHDQGFKRPTIDRYSQAISGGLVIKSLDYKLARDIERYYESAFNRDIERGIDDYAVAVKLCNGLTPEANAANYREIITAYDADVTLFDAARELHTTPRELSNAIAYYVEYVKQPNARLAMLAERQPISRAQFEFNSYKFYEALKLWSAR